MLYFPRNAIATSSVAFLCLIVVGLLQFPSLQQLIGRQQNMTVETLKKEEDIERTKLNLLKKTPSFGYENMMANWAYLNYLQYFGDDEVRPKTGYAVSPEYFEIIIDRDPRFLDAYIGLSTSTSLYAGMPERAIGLMDKGLKAMSPKVPAKSYYIWRHRGIDELLFLGDSQAAKRSFETAAKWASEYNDEESKFVATISQRTADFLTNNPDSKYARIAAWSMVLNNAIDQKTRKRAISELEALGAKIITTPEGFNKIQLPPKD